MLLGDLCRLFTFPFVETRASISLFHVIVSQPLMLGDSLRDCPGVLPADLMPPNWDGRPPPKATLHAVLQVGIIAKFGNRALPRNETILLLSLHIFECEHSGVQDVWCAAGRSTATEAQKKYRILSVFLPALRVS